MANENPTIKAIRTDKGNAKIDYSALHGAPVPQSNLNVARTGEFADALAVKNQLDSINKTIKEIQLGDALAGVTINGKPLKDNPVLAAKDVGAAKEVHNHDASNITGGTLSIQRGGTGASNGADGLKNLLAAGAMILTEGQQYGTSTPTIPSSEKEKNIGRIFFVKV